MDCCYYSIDLRLTDTVVDYESVVMSVLVVRFDPNIGFFEILFEMFVVEVNRGESKMHHIHLGLSRVSHYSFNF